MKNILTILVLIGSIHLNAQVSTVTSSFTTRLTKSDLPFSGDRKVYAVGLNDRKTENILVVSKNAIGAEGDELYIEKFTKNSSGGYDLTFSHKKTHPKNRALVFVNNRAMLIDNDKDGYMELMYMLREAPEGVDFPAEKTTFFIVANNQAYEVWVLKKDNYQENYFSDNFSELPQNLQDEILNFWNKLNKE